MKFYTSVAKGLKLKVRKFWGLIPAFFAPPPLPPMPILNRVKTIFDAIKISFNLPLIVIETSVIENEAKKITLNTDDKK